jgi:hypothetical protein
MAPLDTLQTLLVFVWKIQLAEPLMNSQVILKSVQDGGRLLFHADAMK